RLEQDDRPAHVVVVVADRLFDRLPGRFQCGEMDAGVKPGGYKLIHRLAITDVELVKLRCFPDYPGDTAQHRAARVGEVVDDHRFMPGLDKRDHGVTPDEARTSGDQDTHWGAG